MASLADLGEQLRVKRSLSQELACKIRAAEKPASAGGEAVATFRMRRVALMIFAMAGGDFDAPAAYLQQKGRRAHAPEIQSWLQALSNAERAGLTEQPQAGSQAFRQWSEAKKFTSELQIVSWIKRQNKMKSLAPSPGAVLKHASSLVPVQPKKNSRYKWLQRLMSRASGRKGLFAVGARLSPHAFQAKAPRKTCFRAVLERCSAEGRISTPLSGPDFRPSIAPLMRGPETRPRKRHSFPARQVHMVCTPGAARQRAGQVLACWRWSNFLESLNTEKKPVLRINVDESSLKMHVAMQPGLVVEPCAKRRRQMLREGQGADLGTRRAAVALIAFACDVGTLQPLLPQVVVCNERLMNIGDLEDVADQCGPTVWLVRRRSSWVNAEFMVTVIRLLAKCLTTPCCTWTHALLTCTRQFLMLAPMLVFTSTSWPP